MLGRGLEGHYLAALVAVVLLHGVSEAAVAADLIELRAALQADVADDVGLAAAFSAFYDRWFLRHRERLQGYRIRGKAGNKDFLNSAP